MPDDNNNSNSNSRTGSDNASSGGAPASGNASANQQASSAEDFAKRIAQLQEKLDLMQQSVKSVADKLAETIEKLSQGKGGVAGANNTGGSQQSAATGGGEQKRADIDLSSLNDEEKAAVEAAFSRLTKEQRELVVSSEETRKEFASQIVSGLRKERSMKQFFADSGNSGQSQARTGMSPVERVRALFSGAVPSVPPVSFRTGAGISLTADNSEGRQFFVAPQVDGGIISAVEAMKRQKQP